jgi:hypothetical protein
VISGEAAAGHRPERRRDLGAQAVAAEVADPVEGAGAAVAAAEADDAKELARAGHRVVERGVAQVALGLGVAGHLLPRDGHSWQPLQRARQSWCVTSQATNCSIHMHGVASPQ